MIGCVDRMWRGLIKCVDWVVVRMIHGQLGSSCLASINVGSYLRGTVVWHEEKGLLDESR